MDFLTVVDIIQKLQQLPQDALLFKDTRTV